jgi:hypothetical protein
VIVNTTTLTGKPVKHLAHAALLARSCHGVDNIVNMQWYLHCKCTVSSLTSSNTIIIAELDQTTPLYKYNLYKMIDRQQLITCLGKGITAYMISSYTRLIYRGDCATCQPSFLSSTGLSSRQPQHTFIQYQLPPFHFFSTLLHSCRRLHIPPAPLYRCHAQLSAAPPACAAV